MFWLAFLPFACVITFGIIRYRHNSQKQKQFPKVDKLIQEMELDEHEEKTYYMDLN